MKDNQTNMTEQSHPDYHLEPRVAKLEVGLDRLTDTVKDLAGIVRSQGEATERGMQALTVAVTQAQAPKKTDWGLFISAIGLILALGAAVLIPINNATNDNKARTEAYHQSMVEHMKLDMHPVGQAKVDALTKEVEVNRAEMAKRDEVLDTKIQKETQLMTDLISARLEALDKRLQVEMGLKAEIIAAKMQCGAADLKAHERQDELEKQLANAELRVIKEKNDLYVDKLFGRVQELERERIKIADNEHAELMLWRQKAMGLSTPNAVVPLVPREASDLSPKK
jgi:hypothetical protein